MKDTVSIRLSVVIPAYNEERRLSKTLDAVLGYLAEQEYRTEVIVVDDGSNDATAKLVQDWRPGPVPLRLVSHPDGRNHGKGAAVRLGMLEARGRFRLFMDADNSTTIDHIERFWSFFYEGYDAVIGSRGLKESVITEQQPWYRKMAGEAGNLIIRSFAVPGILDTQAGFKMLTDECTEDVFQRLTIDRWGFDVELLAVARHRKHRVKEVPITWKNDPEGKVTIKAYFEVLVEVWRVRRNLKAGTYD
jgi:dolichyl-phosphate beta-glucosyltransferase